MPKCNSCSEFFDQPSDLELVRTTDNRWVSMCRNCRSKGINPDDVKQVHLAVEDAAMDMAEKQGIDVSVIQGDPIANAQKLLEALKTMRLTTEKVGKVRGHERHSVDMTVSFTLARDDVSHEGFVKDLSQGGMLIMTHKKLERGQILQFDWKNPMPSALSSMLQNQAEVRRVARNTDDTFSIGLKFIKRQAAKSSNRRRFKRYKCDMLAYCQLGGSDMMQLGKVTDISQGGCQLMLDTEVAPQDKFFLRIIGGGGDRGDLVGSVQACRVIPRDMEFEIGCSFVKMRIERIADFNPNEAQQAIRS